MRIQITVAGGLAFALALGGAAWARPMVPADEGAPVTHESPLSPAEAQQLFAQHPLDWARLEAAAAGVSGKARPDRPVALVETDRRMGTDAFYTWSIDDFDSSAVLDPLLWVQVRDLNDEGSVHWGEYFWNLSRCRSKSPSQSLWPFGGGADGSQLACDANYPNGAASSAIMLINPKAQFPATAPTSLRMAFDVWFNLRDFQEAGVEADGLFVNLIIPPSDTNPQPQRVTLLHRTGRFPERFFDDPIEIDFLAAQNVFKPEEVINLFERGDLFIEFLALTQRPSDENPAPTTFQSGMFIDNIRWIADTMPETGGTPVVPVPPTGSVPTATPEGPRPTDPPPPTHTPTEPAPTDTPGTGDPTATPENPEPSATATSPRPTTPPDQWFIHLPWLQR